MSAPIHSMSISDRVKHHSWTQERRLIVFTGYNHCHKGCTTSSCKYTCDYFRVGDEIVYYSYDGIERYATIVKIPRSVAGGFIDDPWLYFDLTRSHDGEDSSQLRPAFRLRKAKDLNDIEWWSKNEITI